VFTALNSLNPDVPILIGATSEEFMSPKNAAPRAQSARDVVKSLIKPGHYEQDLRNAYAAEHSDPLGLAITNIFFHRGVRDVLKTRPKHTYSYLFDYQAPVSGRAGHCLELPFSFDCLNDPHVALVFGPEPNQAVADDMHAAWVSFIKTGNPGWQDATKLENRVYQADGGHTVTLASTEDFGI
jgi:para-nitrobenzyl esterase